MFMQRKILRVWTALALAFVLAVISVPAAVRAAEDEAEAAATATPEIVSSYPYTTVTRVKVNLRASRSVRSELLRRIPAGAEITVNSVSTKSGWASVDYGKYSGYVKSEYIVLKEVKKIKVTPTPTPVPTLSPEEDAGGYQVLQKGASGQEVTALQEALIELGYLKGTADGKFGAATEKAVKAFQEKNEYPATGIMDANIQAFLYTGNPKNASGDKTNVRTLSPVEGVSMKKGNKGSQVTALQERLQELGYYKWTITGTYDTNTIGAVRSFQKKNGLKSDGTAGAETQKAIYSADAVAANATPTPEATEMPIPTPTPTAVAWQKLGRDDAGDAVAQLQEALAELGYLTGKIDGTYGAQTAAAVKAFQKANGLSADGIAGEETQKLLYGGNAKAAAAAKATATPNPKAKATATPAPTASVLKTGAKGTEVKELQSKLIQLGYLTGKADGVYGAKTAEAVRAFQKASKLSADGVAGAKTLSALSSAKSADAKTETVTEVKSGSASSSSSSSLPSASQVQYANWYEKVKAVARKYPYATVYDFGSGISWQIHIISLGAHADYEPVTANDTAKLIKAFGGNTWTPKAVWVVFSDGSVYLGSTHSMPHEVYHIRDNNFNGHSCLHFPRTQEQVKAIGPYATKHQETIDAAWAVTRKMK